MYTNNESNQRYMNFVEKPNMSNKKKSLDATRLAKEG